MSDMPGFPLKSGFTYRKQAEPGFCVDARCRLEGERHLHEPFGKPRLTPEQEAFVKAVEDALNDLAQRDDQDRLDVDLLGGLS